MKEKMDTYNEQNIRVQAGCPCWRVEHQEKLDGLSSTTLGLECQMLLVTRMSSTIVAIVTDINRFTTVFTFDTVII